MQWNGGRKIELITVDEDAIRIYLPYNLHEVRYEIKTIPNRRFRKTPQPHWIIPHSPWHARRLKDIFRFYDLQVPDALVEIGIQDEKSIRANRPASGRKLRSFFDYQVSSVEFGRARQGRYFIGDDVGLGKTIEALGYLWYTKSTTDGPVIVVAPANVIYKWADEIEDPQKRFAWSGKWTSQVVSTSKLELEATDFHIMSYGIMRNRLPELLAYGYEAFIIDEAHYIKEPRSLRTRAAIKLGAGIPKVIALSGTPILNRPIELYPVLNLLEPSAWPKRSGFGFRYCGGITSKGTFVGASHLDELSERLSSIMIRRLKHEVLDSLPPITVSVLPVDVDLSEYRKIEANVRESILELSPNSKGRWVQALDRLNYLRGASAAAKLPVSLAWAQNFLERTDEKRKLCIYAHHRRQVSALRDGLDRYGGVGTITGSDSGAARRSATARFQGVGKSSIRTIIISGAGAEGIDLHGRSGVHCGDILFSELCWRPSDYAQAWGRLHRQGQHHPVNAWILQAHGTIDPWMTNGVDSKAVVIDKITGDPPIIKQIVEAWTK